MYFSHLHSHTAPNNNLQRDAIALLGDMSNRLVPDADKFYADLKLQIAVINEKNPRCIPLHPSRYAASETNIGFYLGGKITVSFHLYKVKEASIISALSAPIDMLIFCPKCGTQHVDAPDGHPPIIGEIRWDNPPHKSHLCHGCGIIFRIADIPTNGVAAVKTRGKADTWPKQEAADA